MSRCSRCGHDNPPTFRFCAQCGARATATAVEEQRKRVTVLFCDVIASTELGERLDPETLRHVLERYFATHGTSRAPRRDGREVHRRRRDGRLRRAGRCTRTTRGAAPRAAAELRAAMKTLNDELSEVYGTRPALRIGVNTGEVVTGHGTSGLGDGRRRKPGRSSAAVRRPGRVLIGAETYTLVRSRGRRRICPAARGQRQVWSAVAAPGACSGSWASRDGSGRPGRADGRSPVAELRLFARFPTTEHVSNRTCSLVTIRRRRRGRQVAPC